MTRPSSPEHQLGPSGGAILSRRMAERNWGMIVSGATFEALVRSLLSFDDPTAALFGRQGRDGGQDARSSDGARVFQMKHHEDGSAAKAIADAKKEAAKIREFRMPDHGRHGQWKGVTQWRLVTNARFNAADLEKWTASVVPLFEAQGLAADFWDRTKLDGLLDRNPEVNRSFFESETRVFLALPEIRERLLEDEPFLQRTELGHFFGREDDLALISEFLSSSHLLLVVHGAGGIGKTRLLVEAGERAAETGKWQVLGANVATMAATSTWFDAIITERPTVLLVDDPPDDQLLRVLVEQLRGRAAQWKVLVAARSPNDTVLRFLRGPRMKARVQEIQLAALGDAAAEAMCVDLMRSGSLARLSDAQREEAAREMARHFSRCPVWLTLAVHVLETGSEFSSVPKTADALAEHYLNEVTHGQDGLPADQVLALLRHVALIGTVSRFDDTSMMLIGEGCGARDATDVRQQISRLVARRALIERGAHQRLIELKPDVLRDHVLLTWLSTDLGYGDGRLAPSPAAAQLVRRVCGSAVAGKATMLDWAILVSLARTELLLRLQGHDVSLVDEFFRTVAAAVPALTASQRIAIARALVSIAGFCPVETTSLATAMRTSMTSAESIHGPFKTRTLGHDDVVLALAWLVFHAAPGARTPEAQKRVLDELCAITVAEAELSRRLPRALPNDGKRAASLLERTLDGGPGFWEDYADVASEKATEILSDVAVRAPSPGTAALLKAVAQHLVVVERHRTWSDDQTFHFQTYAIGPGQPGWATRNALRETIMTILASEASPLGSRVALWHVFAEAHRSLSHCRLQGDEKDQQACYQQYLGDLLWAHGVLVTRGAGVEELTAARDLWESHYRFSPDDKLKAASVELEALYAGNVLTREFEPLIGRENWPQRETRAAEKAAELVATNDSREIDLFLDRATQFLGSDAAPSRFSDIALNLGRLAPDSDGVRAFVRTTLERAGASPRSIFAAVVAASWIRTLRVVVAPEEVRALVVDLMRLCGSEDQRLDLVLRIYGGLPWGPGTGDVSREEHDLIRGLQPLFLARKAGPAFVGMLAGTIHHQWEDLRAVIERALAEMPPEQTADAVSSLVERLFQIVQQVGASVAPVGLGPWLLDQVLRVPDLDDLGHVCEWYLPELLSKVGKAPLSWLPSALEKRRDLENKGRSDGVPALGFRVRLGKLVARIEPSNLGDSSVALAVEKLVSMTDDRGSVGYHLRELIGDVDPAGLAIPAEVARRAVLTGTPDRLRPLARTAGAYVIGSAPWREIATPVLKSAAGYTADQQRSLFHELVDRGSFAWSARVGEVAAVFRTAVEDAKRARDAETDAAFRPFWSWRVEVAEATLRQQEEERKEDRGG